MLLRIFISALFWQFVLAESKIDDVPPIRRFDYVQTANISGGQSKLSVIFKAFNRSYQLSLTPAIDLLMPEAQITFVDGKDNTISQKPLIFKDILAYKGEVHQDGQPVGWARITFHSDPSDSDKHHTDQEYDGIFFTEEHGLHHIKTIHSYRLSRRSVDIDIDLDSDNRHYGKRGMIIFKDIDQAEALEAMRQSNIVFVSMPDMCGSRSDICLKQKRGLFKRDNIITSPSEHSCSNTGSGMNSEARKKYMEQIESKIRGRRLDKRQAATGCPAQRLVLPMAAAADCTYIASYGTPQAAFKQILSNWNSASQLFESEFNIALGLIEVKLVSSCGDAGETPPLKWNRECSTDYLIDQRLSDFSEWRDKKSRDNAGLWHLMTRCSSGPSVGVAWLGMLCATTAFPQTRNGQVQYVSGTGVSSLAPVEWKVVAHEIGHNFGAIHDCTSRECPATCNSQLESCRCCPCGTGGQCDCQGNFLMHPTDNSRSTKFSPCSTQAICGAFPKLGTCLKQPSELRVLRENVCGNGVKEGSEQCDCGDRCDSDPCCTSDCRLKTNAVCSDANDECCTQCQFKSRGTVCRESIGVCDPVEQCDGTSGTCPNNVFIPNGTPCNGSEANTICASGVCTNRDLQCRSYSSLLKLQGSCRDSSFLCDMACTDGSSCYSVSGYYLDGTPCGSGGSCVRGQCQNSNIINTITDWFRTNPQIAIPVAVAVGVLVLVIFGLCLRSCCCRKKPKAPKFVPAERRSLSNNIRTDSSAHLAEEAAFYRAPASNISTPQSTNWVDPSQYNGSSNYSNYAYPGTPVYRT